MCSLFFQRRHNSNLKESQRPSRLLEFEDLVKRRALTGEIAHERAQGKILGCSLVGGAWSRVLRGLGWHYK
jgi:hypothetical protein